MKGWQISHKKQCEKRGNIFKELKGKKTANLGLLTQ